MDKKHYWQSVKDSLSKQSDMTFPTLILLDDEDNIKQVYLKNNVLVDNFQKQYPLSSLKVASIQDGVNVVKDKKKLLDALHEAKLFSYQPN